MMTENLSELLASLDARSDVATIKLAIANLNGSLRGKRLPLAYARKALSSDIKLPYSTMFMDIWGRDVYGTGKVLETGDCDALIVPTERGFVPLGDGTCLLPMRMQSFDRVDYEADPRNALAAVQARFAARGLTPVCAFEMEFYLCVRPQKGDSHWMPQPVADVERSISGDTYALASLDGIEAFLDDVYRRCEDAAIPVEAAVSESGRGQFEINLAHRDALRAADDAFFFKEILRRTAVAHDMTATFMAKPFGDDAGNGLHVHFSLVDEQGGNVFANGSSQGSATLHSAVAGAIESMPGTMLFLAPHANSYRRFQGGGLVSPRASWGYENRTAALRIPAGPDSARRIEHRIAGADANPYLVLAAILGAALDGIEREAEPPLPAEGNAPVEGAVVLPVSWLDAVRNLEGSQCARRIFGNLLPDVFAACKRQEMQTFNQLIPNAEIEAYFDTV